MQGRVEALDAIEALQQQQELGLEADLETVKAGGATEVGNFCNQLVLDVLKVMITRWFM